MVARADQDHRNCVPPTSSRKVKTGCRTCKRRKVKCDEGWPVCNRCQSTGRKCDGYGVWGGGSRASDLQSNSSDDRSVVSRSSTPVNVQQSPIRSIQVVALRTGGETECFEWFIHRSSTKLPGVFRSNNWTTILFQASTAEPAIRHAMLALSSAHKEEVRGTGYLGKEEDGEQTLFTTSQYSKAITSLQPYLNNGGDGQMRVALISCVLFVWMEFLRGHYKNSILHLEHGLTLLRRTDVGVKGQDPWSICVDGWIITIFTRILVQAKLLGQTSRLACQSLLGLNLGLTRDRFSSVHHARRSLEHIMLRVLDVSQQFEWLEAGANGTTSILDMIECRDEMRDALQVWFTTVETTTSQLTESTTPFAERFAYRILRLYYYMTYVMAGTCLEASGELEFDQYQSTFLKIINHCIETHQMVFRNGEHIYKSHRDPEPSSPNSVSDLGWIAPLYYTATKCRNHRIRCQAIQFLEISPHKEGIWNSPMTVAVVKRIAQIEEGSFFDYLGDTSFGDLDAPKEQDLIQPSLPVNSRVDKIEISLPEDRAGVLAMRCRRPKGDGTVEWISQECDIKFYRWVDSSWMSDT